MQHSDFKRDSQMNLASFNANQKQTYGVLSGDTLLEPNDAFRARLQLCQRTSRNGSAQVRITGSKSIIGKPARHVSRSDVLDHIAGYCCFIDGPD